MEIKLPPTPDFFNKSIGIYNQRNVQEYLVDSSTPKKTDIFSIDWEDDPSIDDVVQGEIGDCWLIASIQSLLDTGANGKENIKRIFKYVEKDKGQPKYVTLQLYPIKLYVEYKPGEQKTLFKIVSIPNPEPVDIRINVQKDNIIKELGKNRYEFKTAADWVKYIELAFKKFYRDKYITFVGDGWEEPEQGANYIYRHLNDALMNLKKGKEIGGNLNYGYPLVGQSVLSGRIMESSWMDVAMGYGETNKSALPLTPAQKSKADIPPNNPPKPHASSTLTPEQLKKANDILRKLNNLKQYAFRRLNESGQLVYTFGGPDELCNDKYSYSTQDEYFKKATGQECNDDDNNDEEEYEGYANDYRDHEYKSDNEIESDNADGADNNDKNELPDEQRNTPKLTNNEIRAGRFSGLNSHIRPTCFMQLNGSSHVMQIRKMYCPLYPTDTDVSNVYLTFRNTWGPTRTEGSKKYESQLSEIIKRDPTFTVIAEAKNHSVEKSKKDKNDIDERMETFKK